MKKESPLTGLLIEEEKVDETIIYELLSPYVRISKDRGNVIPTEKFNKLDSSEKIIVLLLAQKVKVRLKLAEKEEFGPREFAKEFGLPVGTVAPAMLKLRKNGLLSSTEDGKYYVSAISLPTIKNKLIRKETEDGKK